MSHFYQFELWKDCNRNCTFCFNTNKGITSNDVKYKRICTVKNELRNLYLSPGDKVGLIGGEFFGGQINYLDIMFEFITLVHTLLSEYQVDVFITTSFLYKDNLFLRKFLEILPDNLKHNHLTLCTSYDVDGRFHNEDDIKVWENNVNMVKQAFPNVNLHTEIILAQPLIDAVLENKLDIKSFTMPVSFHAPCCGLGYNDKHEFAKVVPNFFPKRLSFLKFLTKGYQEEWLTPDNCVNYAHMSDVLWMEDGGMYKRIVGLRGPIDGVTVDKNYPLPPMHEEKSDYIDSTVRMRWDVLDMWENFNA